MLLLAAWGGGQLCPEKAATGKIGEPLSNRAVKCLKRKKAPADSAPQGDGGSIPGLGSLDSPAFLGLVYIGVLMLVCIEMLLSRYIHVSFLNQRVWPKSDRTGD